MAGPQQWNRNAFCIPAKKMYRINKQNCMQYLTICDVKRHWTLYTTTSIKLPVRCRIWTWNAANTKTYWGKPNSQLVQSKSWSSHCDRIQWNFLKQTAVSRCEGFPMFRGLTSPPSSGCAGGCLIEAKLKTRCPTLCCVYLCSYGVVWNVTHLVSGRSKKVVALG